MSMSAPVEIIAEIANAHQGDPEIALEIARRARDAGVDSVKFQLYFAEELLTTDHPRFEHFRRQAFSRSAWARVLDEAKALGTRVYCDVFGLEAFAIARDAGVDGYKVHSSDLTNAPLLEGLASGSERLLLAVGGSTLREIAYSLRYVLKSEARRRPVLLHGFQEYPTVAKHTELSRMAILQQTFGETCDIGYMDHAPGGTSSAFELSLVAVGLGAKVIEKHITLDRSARGTDYYSSLEPEELARFVRAIRETEAALGSGVWNMPAAEREYRRQVKKVFVAARPLRRGKMLALEDLCMKRAPEGAPEPIEIEKLIGRELLSDIAVDAPIRRSDVKTSVWCLVVARLKSARLPEKALADVGGMAALEHMLRRLQLARTPDRIVLCTTSDRSDDRLETLAERIAVPCYRGSIDDVLLRMLGAIGEKPVDIALRATGDDILVDPEYLDRAVDWHIRSHSEYTDLKSLPSGTEIEVFDVDLLRDLYRMAKDSGGTEYLTSYVRSNASHFRVSSVPVDPRHARDWRLTIDTEEDYQLVRALVEGLLAKGKGHRYTLDDIVEHLTDHPELLEVNAGVRQRQTPPSVSTDLAWNRLAPEGSARSPEERPLRT